jgi:hypothetical protein
LFTQPDNSTWENVITEAGLIGNLFPPQPTNPLSVPAVAILGQESLGGDISSESLRDTWPAPELSELTCADLSVLFVCTREK